MGIADIAKRTGCAVTAELGPPKGTNLEGFLKQAAFLKGRVHGVNVTDGQAGLMKLGSLAACHKLKVSGIEPILQITCRDRNRIALQSDLLSASVLGIENVLVLTGDPVTIGDHPTAKPVFDLDAGELMATVKKLGAGLDLTDHKLDGAARFSIGAAMNPCVEDLETEISKTRRKIESGADFFQTQGVFDPARFERFITRYHKERFTVPILAGIILVKSVKMAVFMNEKIPGIVIPPQVIARFDGKVDGRPEATALAADLIRALKPYVQGFHLMALGWEDLVPDIVDRAGIQPSF